MQVSSRTFTTAAPVAWETPRCGLVAHQTASVDQTGLDILALKPGVAFEKDFRSVACSEHAENMLDGETPAADDRLAAKDRWIHRDAFEQALFVHCTFPQPVAVREPTRLY